jgi:DNA-binding NtrC family response regulator
VNKVKTNSFRRDDRPSEPPLGPARPGLVLAYSPSPETREVAYPTPPGATIFGRDESCDVCLSDDGAVSGRHAAVVWEKGRLTLTDLGSYNGIFVRGQRVEQAELAEHDIVRLGRTLFTVVHGDIDGHRDYLPDGTCRTDSVEEARARKARGFAGGLAIDRIARDLERLARSRVTVVLRGESGTGKEVFARYVHARSGRTGSFVAVNAAAIAPGLLEAELFGALRGAYTGATQDRLGHVREAHGGTLFLDEIGDMPLEAQTRLLRVLQEREVVPVGASRAEPVDVRVVAASHRDLGALVAAGRFRGDLHGRLSGADVVLPPLRERRADIVPLCRLLLDKHGHGEVTLSLSFVERLLEHAFPYNVRELEQVLARAVALLPPGRRTLTRADLPDALREGARESAPLAGETAPSPSLPSATPRSEEPPAAPRAAPRGVEASEAANVPPPELLRAMLTYHRGSVARTATAFDVSRTKLYRWLTAYGIDADAFR